MLRTLTAAAAISAICVPPADAQQKKAPKGKAAPVTIAITRCGGNLHLAVDRQNYFARMFVMRGGSGYYSVLVKTSPQQRAPVWFMFNVKNETKEPAPGRVLVSYLRMGDKASVSGLDNDTATAAADALLKEARTLADTACTQEQIAKVETIVMLPPVDPRPEKLAGMLHQLYELGVRYARKDREYWERLRKQNEQIR